MRLRRGKNIILKEQKIQCNQWILRCIGSTEICRFNLHYAGKLNIFFFPRVKCLKRSMDVTLDK